MNGHKMHNTLQNILANQATSMYEGLFVDATEFDWILSAPRIISPLDKILNKLYNSCHEINAELMTAAYWSIAMRGAEFC